MLALRSLYCWGKESVQLTTCDEMYLIKECVMHGQTTSETPPWPLMLALIHIAQDAADLLQSVRILVWPQSDVLSMKLNK